MNSDYAIAIAAVALLGWMWVFVKVAWVKPGKQSFVRGIATPLMYLVGALLLGILLILIKRRMQW